MKNKLKTMAFFVLPSIPVVIIGAYLWDAAGAAVAGVVMLVLSMLIYRFSVNVILKWYGSHKVDSSDSVELHAILDRLSGKAQVPVPDIYVFKSPLPVTFTAGSGKRTSVVLSSETLDMLDRSELEVILAHEIGHIKNGDVPLSTVTALFAGLLASFSTAALWASLLTGFGQEYDPAPRLIRFLAMGLVAPPAAFLVQLAIPKAREYAADEAGVHLTEKPHLLAKTLERIERYAQLQPAEEFNPGHVHMFVTNPLRVEETYDVHYSLFDTHPDIKDRVNNIMRISSSIESGSHAGGVD
ncbi:MAG: M48 family metalloprotease [Methanosarcinaceae archaeon]|nr:M48 family metalloprotease [Methanosarcinaceae archaeon]